MSRSGEVLSVAWRVQLKDTMAGKTLRSWMYVDFSDQTHIGWNEMPPFTAILPGRAPVNVSITPSSGTIASGSKLTLQSAYSEPNGASDIRRRVSCSEHLAKARMSSISVRTL